MVRPESPVLDEVVCLTEEFDNSVRINAGDESTSSA